jgi:hypothetical protein
VFNVCIGRSMAQPCDFAKAETLRPDFPRVTTDLIVRGDSRQQIFSWLISFPAKSKCQMHLAPIVRASPVPT